MEITIRASKKPFDLSDMERMRYSLLGRFSYYMSAFEYDCDEFIFKVAEHNPSFIVEHKFRAPFNQSEARTRFIVLAFDEIAALKALSGIRYGENEQTMKDVLEGIWHHRNNLTHGRMIGSHGGEKGVSFKFARWIRGEKKEQQFHRIQYEYDQSLLFNIIDAATFVSGWLREGINILEESVTKHES
ncbi:hypothetical protein HFO60_15930 [Rhizobium leguminosarum]|uniref:hypothetical protein n=1 Tax=Rhizobium leguminosarum TaxID=384 RepID=UPI001C94B1AA|nr:hypothetical protein [Rhizobium leguminosarum]MBY5541503.1 hypothetical protein [Rhizobium leguminosarum]